ncbi:hypothetical protein ACHAPJ_000913 [Fusarium lateritium]
MACSTTTKNADSRGSAKCTETFWPTIQASLANGEIKFSDLEIPCCICYDTVDIYPHQHRCDESGHHHGAVVLPCGHIFGQQCLRMALKTNEAGNLPLCCPSCRASCVHEECGHFHAGLPMPNSMRSLNSLPTTTGKGAFIAEQCNNCIYGEAATLFEKGAKIDHLLNAEGPNRVGVSITVQGRPYNAPSDSSMTRNLRVGVGLQDAINFFWKCKDDDEASGLYWYDTLRLDRDMKVDCYAYQPSPEFESDYLDFKTSMILSFREQLAGFSDDELRALFDLMVWDITTGSAGFWEYVMNKVTTREYLVSNHQLEVTEEEARSMFARDVLLKLKERKAAV